MQVFIFILITAALIVVLIRYLHGIQVRSARHIADQTTPLPPLDDAPPQRDSIHVAPELNNQARPPLPWQDEVKLLRDSGKFQEAIQLCRRQYPKMLAFRQSLITMRASIKQNAGSSDDTLANLYRTAILASVVKSRQKTPATDADAILGKIEHPRQYWDRLGYKHLDLLTKNDCKLLVEKWGEPKHHGDIASLA